MVKVMEDGWDYSVNIFFVATAIFSLWYLGTEYFKGGTVDDTYIIYRYVENLYSGAGFRWNIGGEKVQGFTSMGWVLVLAATRLFTESEIHTYAPRIGLAFSSVALLLAFFTARRIFSGRIKFFSFLIPLTLALSPAYVRHSISGMETSMVFFMVSLCCLASTFYRSGVVYDITMSILTITSGLTRPDLILIPATIYTSIEIYKSKSLRDFLFSTYIYYVLSLIIGLFYLSWKYIYFGDILPLPAYMKANPERVVNFVKFIFSWQLKFFAYAAVPILISTLSLFTFKYKSGFFVGLISSATLFMLYLLSVTPAMNFHYRYQMAVFIIIVIASIFGLKLLSKEIVEDSSYLSLSVFSAVCIILVIHNVGIFTEIRNESRSLHSGKSERVELAKELQPIDGLMLAGSQAGRLPYFSGVRHIDILGLNTKFVAYNRYDSENFRRKLADYIFAKEPDIYMGYTKGSFNDIMKYDKKEKYIQVKYEGLNVMVLQNSSKYTQIMKAFEKTKD